MMKIPILPDDQSQLDVHGALKYEKVKPLNMHVLLNTYDAHELRYYINDINYVDYID